jgi:hypothetical protein
MFRFLLLYGHKYVEKGVAGGDLIKREFSNQNSNFFVNYISRYQQIIGLNIFY